ncbi:MAG: ATP-binding protein [Saprospiraceae bacterium]
MKVLSFLLLHLTDFAIFEITYKSLNNIKLIFQQQLNQIIYILTIFLIVTIPSFAQNTDYIIDVQYFSTENGLSHRNVKSIFQDRDGMMWIGTQNGLNRFDGYNFKHWLDKNHGVDLRNIRDIGQDDEGWLWIDREKNGLLFFNPTNEVFQTIEERFGTEIPLEIFKRYASFLDFPVDKDGRIYINNDVSNVMYRYHSSEGFTKLIFPLKLKTTTITLGKKDGELYYIDPHSTITGKRHFEYIFSIAKTEGKEIHYKIKEEKAKFDENIANSAFVWKQTSGKSLDLYNRNGTYLTGVDETDIKHRIRNSFRDKEHRVWLGTDFGFYMVSFQKNWFDYIGLPYDNLGNGRTSARGIFSSQNEILACLELDFGLAKYDFVSQKWTSVERINAARAIYPSKEGGFWIGAGNQVVYWNNGKITETHTVERAKNGGPGFSSWCFSPSLQNNNLLWFGTQPGLFKLNTAPNVTDRLIEIASINKFNLGIQYITPDLECNNCIWLCTNEGLWLFDETTEKVIEKYDWNQKGKNYLPSDNIYHLYAENKKTLWIGTANGVIRWNRRTNEYRQITIEDGLPNNVIYAIYPDDFGNLWMSSDYGIIKMNKETFAIENFLPKDGIGQTEYNRVSHFEYRDEQGNQRLFFGGLDGITAFYPKDFEQDETLVQPQIALLTYKQFSGKKQIAIDKTVEIKETNRIIIPPNDYISELEVGLLSYDNVDNNQYLYQLNDGDWQVQKKRNIQLGQLPYGSHQLRIKAKTISNTPSANILEYTIIVKRPFYLTWWFIVLALVSVVGFGIYWYQRRTQQFKTRQAELEKLVKERTAKIEKQAEELKKLDVLKSRFFANVSHELRTPLTLILGPINTILKRGNLTNRDFTMLTKAKQSGRSLLKLVGSILDLSKMEANKMTISETTIMLFPFIRRVISAFESHAQREGIGFNFQYNGDENLQLELDKEKLEIIINNLLSNAIKFTTKGGKVSVIVTDNKSNIQISVTDTGRGIHSNDLPNVFNRFYQSEQENAKTEGGTGIGLALSREYIELMNGKIWAESELGIGSQFYITLPRKEVLGMVEMPKIEKEIITEQAFEPIITPIKKSNKQILIVEDNYSLRDYIQTIIEPHYEIITAENGQVAYDLLSQNNTNNKQQPDFILSDIMMPVMDGYQLLTHLKSKAYLRNIPVVMLTARADMQDKLKALRIGVDDYMLKPFDEEELLTRIANLLANYEVRQSFLKAETTIVEKSTNEILISDDDQKWLENLENLIIKEMNNSLFSNDYLAETLFISTKTLYRKVKTLTGLTPTKYIRTIRLQKSKILLEAGKSVSETAHEVGFQKVEYFSKLFKKEFGKSPSEYK